MKSFFHFCSLDSCKEQKEAAKSRNEMMMYLYCQEPEKTLDIFNITLVRQQAEMEVSSLVVAIDTF